MNPSINGLTTKLSSKPTLNQILLKKSNLLGEKTVNSTVIQLKPRKNIYNLKYE